MTWDSSALLRGLSQQASRMHEGAMRGLGDWGELVLDEAVRLVPHVEGTLQDSGTVAQSLDGMTVGIGFGQGAAAAYAGPQHERLDYVHTDPTRQAKYLEQPLMRSRSKGLQIVAKAIRGRR